ncbi:MAG: LysR substrate-binding domain-containing protein [Pseudomonadota bacterium]|nr:LysR substrate-binding domain-containing protein [Pseudomonadota bacterium]
MAKYPFRLLNSLPAFEAAARHQSIQRAAKELHVNHAAVSRHINKLELYIGCQLFERAHRTIALTEDGAMLFNAVTTGFAHIGRVLMRLSRNRYPERLVISVDPDFAGLWLVPRLAEFYAIMPNTLVEIRAEKGTIPPRDPQIDCVIHYAEADSAEENGEVLFRSSLFPVCSKSLAQTVPLNSLDDLRQHVLLHDRSTDEWEDYLRTITAKIEMNARVGNIFSETAHCLDAAVRGQGVALGDDFLAAMHLSEGRLVRPGFPSVPSKNAYFLAISENAPRHPSVDAFRTWLLKGVARQRESERDQTPCTSHSHNIA